MSSGVKRLKTLKVDRSLRMRRLKDCQNRRTERDASLPSVTRTAGRILCLAATRTRRWACGVLNGSAFGSEVGSGCLSAAHFEFVAAAPLPRATPASFAAAAKTRLEESKARVEEQIQGLAALTEDLEELRGR
jgi:hypothetical protein